MKFKIAFIFVAPESNPSRDRWTLETPTVELVVIGTQNYDEAERESKRCAEEGVKAIELCGAFGNIGVGRIAQAVDIPVGVVRYDTNPTLGNKSGDAV